MSESPPLPLPLSPPRRPTLGFLAGNLHMGIAPRRLWPGMIAAARKLGVNLFCFPGGKLHPVGEFHPERSLIYDLVDVTRLDGLISSGASAPGGLDPDQTVAFLRRYQPLPILSLTRLPGEIPHVTMDSYEGMKAIILHLIQTHGLHRLAFVRGPENHYYAQERYQAYLETLQAENIPFDPRLVTPPMPWEAGEEGIRILLDERGLRPGRDLQALVTVSDLAALSALRTLQARGLQVPGDLALTGFNSSEEGRVAIPPLTSVSMPFYEQGERAIETLVAHLAGQPLPPRVVLPTRLLVRQSCGCPDQAMVLADLPLPSSQAAHASLDARRNEATEEIVQMLGAGENQAPVSHLVAALCADLYGAKTSFLPALEQILHSAAERGDVSAWHDAISILRRYCLSQLDHAGSLLVENLFGQARVMISGVAQRTQALAQLQTDRQAVILRDLGQALITTFDTARLTDMLAEQLPAIGIASCYLALYEKPDDESRSFESSRLILAYTEQGRVALDGEGRRFPSREVVPPDLLPLHRQYSYVVEPLFFQQEQIGFVVFEVGPPDGAIYELLRSQISSALKGALLLRDAQQARQAAEKADRIKSRLLANVSHELRTPLNIILGYSQDALGAFNPYEYTPPQTLLDDLDHIRRSAEHQLRVVNDLLDLSRAEIDELDLYLELLDPRPLLLDAFQSISHSAGAAVTWRLQLPERLPLILADPVRLRQVLLNLLSNARNFTEQGEVVLGAQVEPPHLHLWVQDTGAGISPAMQERIFEPFVTAEHPGRRSEGIGLGLSITRRLVALHHGSMQLESTGRGSTFHIDLPLPNLAEKTAPVSAPNQPVLLLISASEQPAAEIIQVGAHQGLALLRVRASDDLEAALFNVQPAALAFDLAGAKAGDWAMVRRLRHHPRLSQVPFILYGQGEAVGAVGLTSVVPKPVSTPSLLEMIQALSPNERPGPILIVDDDPAVRLAHQNAIAQGLPDYPIRAVQDGAAALAAMEEEVPTLVLLDLMMPEMDGFDVLERMRAAPRTQAVPVVVLTNKILNLDDIKRIEQHTRVVVQSKGVLDEAEIIATLHRALFGTDTLPPQTSALVKRAVAYLHQNYARPLTRWEIAEAIGVSENYLSRVFNQELGLSPWDYLNRFRVSQAKELLRRTQNSVKRIAAQVGFKDQKYFSRVFHKVTGVSPNEFREQTRR